jgi:hypothetical protein
MERLVAVVQELSLARDLSGVMAIVRSAARELTGADGATFVLRDGDLCHYADEDAIAPLWKGWRFPMSTCISGWVMLQAEPAVIEDIYADPRIPAEAYRPTFVKSLAMVPIRARAPIGAIGAYWAQRRVPTAEELRLLQALADSTSIALENVRLYMDLEERVRDRTNALELAVKELDAFSYSVSHDLRAPLRAITGYTRIVLDDEQASLPEECREYLEKALRAGFRMNGLIEDLLQLSRVARSELTRVKVDLTELALSVVSELSRAEPARKVAVVIAPGLQCEGDPGLLRVLIHNLLDNAWKFTMRTVHRIVRRHGGTIRAESAPNNGAAFYWTLCGPDRAASEPRP